MNIDPGSLERLHFLVRVVRKESAHLEGTEERLSKRELIECRDGIGSASP
jgi:hypothetical protein